MREVHVGGIQQVGRFEFTRLSQLSTRARLLAVNEERISSSLTRPANWKIPSHYFIAQRAKHATTAAAQRDCPISNVIRQMARKACGLPRDKQRKAQFRIFG